MELLNNVEQKEKNVPLTENEKKSTKIQQQHRHGIIVAA